VSEGLEVTTDSERVARARAFIAEMLLARCPESEEIRGIARQLGVGKARFASVDAKEKCILCGLCVRVCRELIGEAAIGFVGRGVKRVVETPFGEAAEACVGCGACAVVCPTGAIEIADRGGKRALATWHTERTMVACAGCGEPFSTTAVLERLKAKLGLPMDALDYCGKCRRKRTGKEIGAALKGPPAAENG
jgi:ferredoxin